MKKAIHEISIEELLKSLDGEDLSKEAIAFSYTNPILSFIQTFELKAGKELVSDKVLHTLFKFWYKNEYIDQRSFNHRLGTYIPSHVSNRRYYHVNKNILELAQKTQELYLKRKRPRVKSKVWNTHFEKFLSDTGLEPGNVYVEMDILYYVYNRWCDDTRKKSHLAHESFSEICKLNFESKRICRNKISWVGVNEKIKDLITLEEVERWRQHRKTNGKENNSSYKPYRPYQKEVLYQKKVKKK
jgi:hypothetical protein